MNHLLHSSLSSLPVRSLKACILIWSAFIFRKARAFHSPVLSMPCHPQALSTEKTRTKCKLAGTWENKAGLRDRMQRRTRNQCRREIYFITAKRLFLAFSALDRMVRRTRTGSYVTYLQPFTHIAGWNLLIFCLTVLCFFFYLNKQCRDDVWQGIEGRCVNKLALSPRTCIGCHIQVLQHY